MSYFSEKAFLNNSFLFGVFAVSAVTNLNCGFALASFNASGILLQKQQNWTELQITIITSLGIFGLMLGALFTDKILTIGRLKTMHLANLIMIVSVVPQMFLTIPSLCIGRFLLGFGSGVCIVATSVFVAEMVPADKVSIYGTSVNLGIVIGLLITNVIQGESLPPITDELAVMTTQWWRLGFGFPVVNSLLSFIFCISIAKKDTIYFLMDEGDLNGARFQF